MNLSVPQMDWEKSERVSALPSPKITAGSGRSLPAKSRLGGTNAGTIYSIQSNRDYKQIAELVQLSYVKGSNVGSNPTLQQNISAHSGAVTFLPPLPGSTRTSYGSGGTNLSTVERSNQKIAGKMQWGTHESC